MPALRRGVALGVIVVLAGVLGLWRSPPVRAQPAVDPPAAQIAPATGDSPVAVPVPEVMPESVVVPPGQIAVLPEPRPVYRRRYDLIVAGAGTLVSAWAADRLLYRDQSLNWEPWLPLVGPWFLLNEIARQPDPSQGTMAVLVFDGLAQGAGLVVAVLGLAFLREKRMLISLPQGKSLTLLPAGRTGLAIAF